MTTSRARRVIDVIAWHGNKLVLVERLNFPAGLAFPGGKIEGGERPIGAAVREFYEETGMQLSKPRYWRTVSAKKRDPRFPTVDRVYTGKAEGIPKNEGGKTRVLLFTREELLALPKKRFAFDHFEILQKFLEQ